MKDLKKLETNKIGNQIPQMQIKRELRNCLASVFLFVFIFGFSSILFSASIPTEINDLEEQISIKVVPEFPRPNDSVTITLSAYGTNLNLANIVWSINDKQVKQGKGEVEFKTVAGSIGQSITIKAVISPQDGREITKTFNISPQSVDIIWETRTYTPPFYKGKALFTPQEEVIFVAVPNMSGDQSISYKWSQNNTVLGSLSGFNKSTLKYKGNILMRPIETSVVATNESGSVAKNTLLLASTNTETNLYEDSYLYGILFNKEVSNNFDFGNKEERTITAFPYYFGSTNRFAQNILYNWSINYTKIDVPKDQYKMTFRNTENVEGKSFVSVGTSNKSNFLQNSVSNTFINFKKTTKPIGF